jgi:RNA polymerase sigma factor (sigma-70 family)
MTTITEETWAESYPQLQEQARRLVRQLHVPDWLGQEEDVACDIVQESMCRVYEYSQKAARGERPPVQSLTALLTTVAKNYCRDLRRREYRLSRDLEHAPQSFVDQAASFSEAAVENVYRERLFGLLARLIAQFPPKQRRALLIDLAERMAFGDRPSVLQAAFQAQGIRLEDYRQARANGERERNCSAALMNHALKRLRRRPEIQAYLHGTA